MKLEAESRIALPDLGDVSRSDVRRCGQYLVCRPAFRAFARCGFHFDSFYRQLGFDAGIGLRLDIKFAVLRLDWGIQIHNPNAPAGQRWIHNSSGRIRRLISE